MRRARRLRGRPAARAAGAARDRDAGAGGRARPVAGAGRGDGLARVRPRRRRGPTGPAGSPARCSWPGCSGVCVGVYGLLDGTAPGWLGLPMLLARACCVAGGRAAAGRAAGAAAAATGPTRGGCRSGWSPAGGVAAAAVLVRRPSASTRGDLYPSLDPLSWPALPLAGRARRARRAAAGLAGAAAGRQPGVRGRAAAGAGGGGARDRASSAVDRHATPDAAGAGAARRRPDRRRGRAVPGRRPHRRRASPPCSARSTGWCRTSPAARWPAGSPSPAATPATTRRASWPTWSASSARTRWPASSPTPSRRSSPTAWSSSAVPPAVMRKRVEETLDLLGHRRAARPSAARRCPAASSSGSRSASVLTAHPRVLVLDEPTSALDPTAAEEVLAAITRLVHDLGAHGACWPSTGSSGSCSTPTGWCSLPGDGAGRAPAPPADVLRDSPVAPPVVELGRLAGWSPAAAVGPRRPPPGRRRCATGSTRRRRPPAPPSPDRRGRC